MFISFAQNVVLASQVLNLECLQSVHDWQRYFRLLSSEGPLKQLTICPFEKSQTTSWMSELLCLVTSVSSYEGKCL